MSKTRLNFEGWIVEPDNHGWVVSRLGSVVSGKNAGREYRTQASYYPRLQQALESLLDQRLRESGARSVQAVADEIRAFREDLAAIFELGAA